MLNVQIYLFVNRENEFMNMSHITILLMNRYTNKNFDSIKIKFEFELKYEYLRVRLDLTHGPNYNHFPFC